MSMKIEVKEGFEFLQPILDAGIDIVYKYDDILQGYVRREDEQVLLKDGYWHCIRKIKYKIYNIDTPPDAYIYEPEKFDVEEYIDNQVNKKNKLLLESLLTKYNLKIEFTNNTCCCDRNFEKVVKDYTRYLKTQKH